MTEALTTLNFRDLGGLPADGGHVRPSMLFRSEGPKNFDDRHLGEIAALGIKAIFDLRSEGERTDAPHDWQHPECQWLAVDVNVDLRVFGHEGRERLLKGPQAEIAIETMQEIYREIPASLAPQLPMIAATLLNGGVPAVINCTAGKDRTGVAVAFLLEMIGVPRDAIMADYLASKVFGDNMFRDGTIEAGFIGSYGFMPSPGQVDALVGVRADYLETAWDAADQGRGGLNAYFDDAGVDATMRAALRELFVN